MDRSARRDIQDGFSEKYRKNGKMVDFDRKNLGKWKIANRYQIANCTGYQIAIGAFWKIAGKYRKKVKI